MGPILRDRNSDILILMNVSIQGSAPQNPKTTECIELFRGLQLWLNLGINHLIIEFNCQTLIKDLQSNEESTSLMENII